MERGLVPRWVAQPPQNLLARCTWSNRSDFVGAAAPPSAGDAAFRQARSPHLTEPCQGLAGQAAGQFVVVVLDMLIKAQHGAV